MTNNLQMQFSTLTNLCHFTDLQYHTLFLSPIKTFLNIQALIRKRSVYLVGPGYKQSMNSGSMKTMII
jgi:hypothetical protein